MSSLRMTMIFGRESAPDACVEKRAAARQRETKEILMVLFFGEGPHPPWVKSAFNLRGKGTPYATPRCGYFFFALAACFAGCGGSARCGSVRSRGSEKIFPSS